MLTELVMSAVLALTSPAETSLDNTVVEAVNQDQRIGTVKKQVRIGTVKKQVRIGTVKKQVRI